MRPLGGQQVPAALGAPGQVAAQVGFGVLAGGALEAGQVGGHCQPQPVSEWLRRIGGREGQLCECRHVVTLPRLAVTVKLINTHPAAWECALSRHWQNPCWRPGRLMGFRIQAIPGHLSQYLYGDGRPR